MEPVQSKYQLHNAGRRSDLWQTLDDPSHPLNTAWPLFLDQDQTYQCYAGELVKLQGLAKFQFVLVETAVDGQESIVACGRSIPFFWAELHRFGGQDALVNHSEIWDTLPEGGYDSILARGVEQYLAREGRPQLSKPLTPDQVNDMANWDRTEPPNALSAISITVHPNRRSQGLARILIQAMKRTAIDENLDTLVVPLRPTRKKEFPYVDMADYISWDRSKESSAAVDNWNLPFDPWLRSHTRLGAQVIKVARRSMRVEGTATEWHKWTGINLADLGWKTLISGLRVELYSGRLYKDFAFPAGLVPLRFYVNENRCIYVEPNVWLYHDLQKK